MSTCTRGSSIQDTARDQYSANRGSAELPHNTVDTGRSKCFGSIPVIEGTQLHKFTARLNVLDKNGIPVDLSTNPSQYTVKLKAKESWNTTKLHFEITGTIAPQVEDQQKGIVEIAFTPEYTKYSGIFTAQLIVYVGTDPNLTAVWTTNYWLVLNPSVDFERQRGSITIADVRLMLRDTCASQNLLLGDLEFDDSQIASCISLPIDEFNTTWQPKTNYTPSTFPYRFYWLRAACGYLLQTAAAGYARDHLPYNAGGVTVDDKNKAGLYMELSKMFLSDWRNFIKMTKDEMNISSCFGRLKSAYSRIRSR